MMQFYQVGPDSLADYELEYAINAGCRWLVYWYELGNYEGNGEAVAMMDDGRMLYYNLGHCSCNGPMEDFPRFHGGVRAVTLADLEETPQSIFDDPCREPVVARVRELLIAPS